MGRTCSTGEPPKRGNWEYSRIYQSAGEKVVALNQIGHKSLMITQTDDGMVLLYGSLSLAKIVTKFDFVTRTSDDSLGTSCGEFPLIGDLEFNMENSEIGEVTEGDDLRAAIVSILDAELFPAKEHYRQVKPRWWPAEVAFSSFYHARPISDRSPLQEMREVVASYKKFTMERKEAIENGGLADIEKYITTRTTRLPVTQMKGREKKKQTEVVRPQLIMKPKGRPRKRKAKLAEAREEEEDAADSCSDSQVRGSSVPPMENEIGNATENSIEGDQSVLIHNDEKGHEEDEEVHNPEPASTLAQGAILEMDDIGGLADHDELIDDHGSTAARETLPLPTLCPPLNQNRYRDCSSPPARLPHPITKRHRTDVMLTTRVPHLIKKEPSFSEHRYDGHDASGAQKGTEPPLQRPIAAGRIKLSNPMAKPQTVRTVASRNYENPPLYCPTNLMMNQHSYDGYDIRERHGENVVALRKADRTEGKPVYPAQMVFRPPYEPPPSIPRSQSGVGAAVQRRKLSRLDNMASYSHSSFNSPSI